MKKQRKLRCRVRLIAILALTLLPSMLFQFVCTALFSPDLYETQTAYRAAFSLGEIKTDGIKTVVLDAGHGGYDSGAQSESKIEEKNVNLAIVKKAAHFLTLSGVRVILTRSDDTPPSLVDGVGRKRGEILSRAKIANESAADLFLSIHLNAFPQESCRGAQVFYTQRHPQNQAVATRLQNAIQTLLQPDNHRTVKETDLILLLRHTEIPSALLECGFLSNREEAELLNTEDYQNKLAFCICSAILEHLQETSA